mmetsp:Transcript_26566/g.68448  ORF Transcript_26566/g.68448 Transcript_26566/m.68448 type:complete len:352 (-) Transcript_26566:606-1661(-)
MPATSASPFRRPSIRRTSSSSSATSLSALSLALFSRSAARSSIALRCRREAMRASKLLMLSSVASCALACSSSFSCRAVTLRCVATRVWSFSSFFWYNAASWRCTRASCAVAASLSDANADSCCCNMAIVPDSLLDWVPTRALATLACSCAISTSSFSSSTSTLNASASACARCAASDSLCAASWCSFTALACSACSFCRSEESLSAAICVSCSCKDSSSLTASSFWFCSLSCCICCSAASRRAWMPSWVVACSLPTRALRCLLNEVREFTCVWRLCCPSSAFSSSSWSFVFASSAIDSRWATADGSCSTFCGSGRAPSEEMRPRTEEALLRSSSENRPSRSGMSPLLYLE